MSDDPVRNPQIHAKILQAAAGVCRKPGTSVSPSATHVQIRKVAPFGQPPTKAIHTVVESTDGRAIFRAEVPIQIERPFLVRAGDIGRLELWETARFQLTRNAAMLLEPFRLDALPLAGGKNEDDFEPEDLGAHRVPPGAYEPAFTVTVQELSTIASAFKRAGVKRVTVELPPESGMPISFRGAEHGAQGALCEAVLLPESLFPDEQHGGEDGAGDVAGQQTLPGTEPGGNDSDFGADLGDDAPVANCGALGPDGQKSCVVKGEHSNHEFEDGFLDDAPAPAA